MTNTYDAAKAEAFRVASKDPSFTIKDSGYREEFASGMVRDTADDKLDPSLVKDGPMYKRWVTHLTLGAKKYAARNWMKASGQAEYDRFRQSAQRHFDQWFDGETDEDHAAAVFFNINGAEYVRDRGPTTTSHDYEQTALPFERMYP